MLFNIKVDWVAIVAHDTIDAASTDLQYTDLGGLPFLLVVENSLYLELIFGCVG